MESYKTLLRTAEDRVTVMKSVFIGQACPCSTEEEAQSFLRSVREKYKDATHHCYAYIIGTNEGIMRYSDDGELSGTAGLPIISLIRSERVVNCCVVVTRYFGGTLLGTGGLVRAYTQGCRVALNAASIVKMEVTCRFLCEVPYASWDSVKYNADRLPILFEDIQYASAISFTLKTRPRDKERILTELMNISGRTLEFIEDGMGFEAWESD